jgi:hypothetical protein
MIQGLILFPNDHLLPIIDEKKDVITKQSTQRSCLEKMGICNILRKKGT